MNSLFRSKTKGFTLIEVMVVITIVGFLASVVLAALTDARAKARDTQRVQMVKELQKALELYRNENNGNYPCAAVMPACVSGGGQVNVNGSASTTVFNVALAQFLTLPREETVFSSTPTWGSILYRTGGTTAAPQRNSYTILLRREIAVANSAGVVINPGNFCDIRVGPSPNTANWPDANYPDCF
ncbi:prepilin-type N-terminal cleavage/methylation domain-containing protein [Patescibacteria group bacterium]|nr:prepilin-type N-terminal cleavage/methylation domain-containing protein [Patescibacteria group bacterium]